MTTAPLKSFTLYFPNFQLRVQFPCSIHENPRMASPRSVQNWELEVKLTLRSDTPVVGCKIDPHVTVTRKGSAPPAAHSLRFSWYSLQIPCSVHKNKRATHQCQECERSGKLFESYHCSPGCFSRHWNRHVSSHSFLGLSQSEDEYLDAKEQPEKVWIEVGSLRNFKPSLHDLGCELKLESLATDCLTGAPVSPVSTIITQPVISFPERRPRKIIRVGSLHDSRNGNLTGQSSDDFAFSVLSYNILADIYANMPIHDHCPKWALIWENRRENLLDEIHGYNPDVLCLQEVQSDHFWSFFKPRLSESGYSAVYKGKKDTKVFTGSQHVSDGCAIFYRNGLFRLIRKNELDFKEIAQSIFDVFLTKSDKDQYRLLKDNVAVIVTLEVLRKATKSVICVVNTHICSGRFPDVKLFQISNLVRKLGDIVDSEVPMVICGDFNSRPGSDAHTFLVNGRIDSPVDARFDPYEVYKFLKFQRLSTHSLTLASAYPAFYDDAANSSEVEEELREMNAFKQEPLFTCLKPKSPLMLDYIFYTVNNLRVKSLLELLDRESLGSVIPSPEWPSDHVALMARFSFK